MERVKYPTSVRQAFKILDSLSDNDDKKHFLSQSVDEFCIDQHEGLGLWIRNNWIYESDKQCLRLLAGIKIEDFPDGAPEGFEIILIGSPDMVSDQFLHRYYEHLKRTFKNIG